MITLNLPSGPGLVSAASLARASQVNPALCGSGARMLFGEWDEGDKWEVSILRGGVDGHAGCIIAHRARTDECRILSNSRNQSRPAQFTL